MDEANRDRKRAWKAQQRAAARAAFPAPSEALEAFFTSIDAAVEEHGCNHTLRFTEQWLTKQKQLREPFIAWVEDHGGFCDCEVVRNTYDHWEQNR